MCPSCTSKYIIGNVENAKIYIHIFKKGERKPKEHSKWNNPRTQATSGTKKTRTNKQHHTNMQQKHNTEKLKKYMSNTDPTKNRE